jgi:HNH endonuclease
MAGRGRYIPVETKRAVWLHSYGRCQYRECHQKLISVDPLTGDISDGGECAHILPVGDGPRAEFKSHYPNIDLNSAANLILLCPNHHQLVDELEVAKHPPKILFRMKADKSVLIGDSITELLELQSSPQVGIDEYRHEYEVAGVLDQFKVARTLGPKRGSEAFEKAERTLRSMLKNPFFKKGEAGEVLLNIEYHFTKLYLSYRVKSWREALQYTTRTLKLVLPEGLLFHLLSCSMVLVRDEYSAFESQEKLTL